MAAFRNMRMFAILRFVPNCRISHHQHRCSAFKLRCMYSTSSHILSLCDRGVIQTVFPEESVPELSQHLSSPQTVYCGFDPTADSLHIGNLLALICLLHFQAAGHTALAVLGGATALIGDPSGKTSQRQAMAEEEVEKNMSKISANLQQIARNYTTHILKDTGHLIPPLRIINNMEWYTEKTFIDFVHTECRRFRIGRMLAKRSVQGRMGGSDRDLSLTEFLYPVFQSSDWLHLLQHHNCTIQVGGNDQMGNIVSGFDMISRISKQKVFGMTVPLVTSASGEKLGKTAGNAIWLDPSKTSSSDLYQYFINVADTDVEKYLKFFTFLPVEEIDGIISKHQVSPEKRVAQKVLAEQVTLLVHGDVGLEIAAVH